MSNSLGNIRGQMTLDVKQALAAYTSARQAHVSTVTALSTGAGALTTAGASMAAAGVAMGAGIMYAVNSAAEFERKLDYFIAVGGPGAADSYDVVREKALQLGADTIYSADQIADSFVELAKSGVGAEDIINGIGEGVAALGAAADIPLDTAANIITSAVATFNLGADQAVDVANKLAGAANASIIDVQDLGVSLKYAGGVAASLGASFTDVNTALAILGENGIKGSTAGTSLRQVLLGLNGSTGKAKEALKELGIITEDGSNKFYTASGSAKSLAEVFQILQDATAGMSDQQRTATMQQIFATRALPSLIALTKSGAAGFAEMAAEISKTTALDVASQRLDNLSGDLEILRGNLDTLAITMGSTMQGPARVLVQAVTDLIQAFLDLDEKTQELVMWIGTITASILVIIGVMGIFAGQILNIIALSIKLAPVFKFLGSTLETLFTPFTMLFGLIRKHPFGSLITILIAVAGALVYFFTQTESGKAIWATFMETLSKVMAVLGPILAELAGTLGGAILSAITTLAPLFQQLASTLGTLLLGALQAIMPLFITVGNFLMTILGPILPIIVQLVEALSAAFSGIKIEPDASPLSAIVDILTGIGGALMQSFPAIITAVIQLLTLVMEAVVAAIPLLLTAAIRLFTGFISALVVILPRIITGLIALIMGLITALVSMIPILLTGAMMLFTALVNALVLVLPLLIQGLLQLILGIVTLFATLVPVLLEAALQLFLAIVQAIPIILPPLIEALGLILPQIILAVMGMLPMLLEAALQLFLMIVAAVPMIVGQLIPALIGLLPIMIDTVIGLLPMLLNAGIELFMAIVTAIPRIVVALVPAIMDLLPKIVSTLVGMIPQLLQTGIQLFGKIAEAIPKIIPALISAVTNLGTQIINGLISGIGNMAQAAVDAVANVVNGAIGWAKDLLGIKSPSRVFREIGMFTIEGLVVGMEKMQPQVNRQIGQITDTLTDFYNQVGAAKDLDMQVNMAASMGVEANSSLTTKMAQLTDQMAILADKDTIVVEKMEVNNPEPEPASDSLPNSIRKVTHMVG